MTDKHDDLLLRQFFAEASQQEIADDGFSDLVMERIGRSSLSVNRTPSAVNAKTLCRLWTWFCLLVGAVLFLTLGGWAALKTSLVTLLSSALTSLEVLVTTAPTLDLHLNPVLVLLLLVFAAVVLPYQTARRLSAAL